MARGAHRSHSTSSYPRIARVNEVLREVIASTLERVEDDDPRLELVTVTGVDTDTDLRHATVYFSALGTKSSLDEVAAALEEQRVSLQKAIAKGSTMKNTPQLRFVPDMGILEGQKIEDLVRNLPPIVEQPDLDDDDLPDVH